MPPYLSLPPSSPLPNSTPHHEWRSHSPGYKFETLCTLPRPWGEVSRTEIETRPSERVSNKAQYCSIVSANIGPTKVCLAGEIDARRFTLPPPPFLSFQRDTNLQGGSVWGSKPKDQNTFPEWVELKTSATLRSERDEDFFHDKLMRFWVQSYLIGVSRVIVGFRSRDGILEDVKELRTADLPGVRPRNWDADVCVDFTVGFLKCKFLFPLVFLLDRGPHHPGSLGASRGWGDERYEHANKDRAPRDDNR